MSMYGKQTECIRSAYDGSRVPVTVVTYDDRTKQSMKDECDINNILSRYVKTGLLTPVNSRPAAFMDVSEVGDYRQALDNVRAANEYFGKLGAKVRAEFDNDPAAFLDFVSDPSNEDRARELGLLPAREVQPRGADGRFSAPEGAEVSPEGDDSPA